jgi:DNA-binding HxlR family transcriptional regulator
MALLDLLGRRWALRILWELRDATLVFRALRARCDAMSPSVLNQRLGELRRAGIVALVPDAGYRLSREGVALLHALAPLQGWATRWAARAALPDATRAPASAAVADLSRRRSRPLRRTRRATS